MLQNRRLSLAIQASVVGFSLVGVPACGGDEQPNEEARAGGGSGSGSSALGAAGAAGAAGGLAGADAGGAAAGNPGAGMAGAELGGAAGGASGPSFTQRLVIDGLASPWEVAWGPDGWLWITERAGRRVVRVNPSDGTLQVALEIDEVRGDGAQDGLLGMALHPQLMAGTNEDFVYVAYSYDAAAGRRFKIRRYTYDASSGTLASPLDVLSELPASSDHNGGRLSIGPDSKLYYTVGDQGANQFDRKCNLNHAQDLPTAAQIGADDFQAYQGKILRMNLDGAIPADNPELSGVRSHVFSFGHRNPQGIAFGPGGLLFSSEQGPKTDDELNRIEAGKNYGWPLVAGFQDDKAYVYANWSAAPDCAQLAFSDYTLPPSVPQQEESAWDAPNFAPPLVTFYTVDSNHDFQDPKCGDDANVCWPTIAPSSLEVYSAGEQALTGWSDSLLVTSLKQGTVYRVALDAAGTSSMGEVTALFKTTNRYRDVAVNPNGQTFYVITDSQGSTASVDGGATSALENPGSVLEFSANPSE